MLCDNVKLSLLPSSLDENVTVNSLKHSPRICMGHHWLRLWLQTRSVPIHYWANYDLLPIDHSKLISEVKIMLLIMSSAECRPSRLDLNVLIPHHVIFNTENIISYFHQLFIIHCAIRGCRGISVTTESFAMIQLHCMKSSNAIQMGANRVCHRIELR